MKLFNIGAFQSTNGTDNEKGFGLGLLICKDFAEKIGGKIWLESDPDNQSKNKGSIFYFPLPC
jgi:two-component system sensor histidine kinase/response regulator